MVTVQKCLKQLPDLQKSLVLLSCVQNRTFTNFQLQQETDPERSGGLSIPHLIIITPIINVTTSFFSLSFDSTCTKWLQLRGHFRALFFPGQQHFYMISEDFYFHLCLLRCQSFQKCFSVKCWLNQSLTLGSVCFSHFSLPLQFVLIPSSNLSMKLLWKTLNCWKHSWL